MDPTSRSKPPGGWSIARQGWAISGTAWRIMPRLMISATLVWMIPVCIGLTIGESRIAPFTGRAKLIPEAITGLLGLGITASVAIAIHRCILLNEQDDRWVWRLPPRIMTFIGFLLLTIFNPLPAILLGVLGMDDNFPSIEWGLDALALLITMWLLLLFPAIAIGQRNFGWRDAVRLGRGVLGRVGRTLLSSAALMFLYAFGAGITATEIVLIFELCGLRFDGVMIATIMIMPLAPLIVMSIAAMAASASILYRDAMDGQAVRP